jgi:hypothetical protein
VPPEIHEHLSEAFRVLGRRQEELLRQLETACLTDPKYRQLSLRMELQGVRAELAGEDPAAALVPARRAQMIIDELTERPGVAGAKRPHEAAAELVQMLGG